MLVYHRLDGCGLACSIMCNAVNGELCLTLLITNINLDMFIPIALMWSFHVRCLSRYTPKTFTDRLCIAFSPM